MTILLLYTCIEKIGGPALQTNVLVGLRCQFASEDSP